MSALSGEQTELSMLATVESLTGGETSDALGERLELRVDPGLERLAD
jgi:hypothetical protein